MSNRSRIYAPFVPARLAAWGREVALGFPYWLGFLLVLEPGNISRAGGLVAWDHEVLRIFAASVLGAASTPFVLALTRRYPIEGATLWRHATIHSFSGAGIAFGLVAISCVLAAWSGIGDSRPVHIALPEQLAANWLLLVFSIAALTAVTHAVRFFREAEKSRRAIAQVQVLAPPTFLTAVTARSRNSLVSVKLASVDWIETQGNYLALHAGPAVHLVRETSQRFESKLDPNNFVRIHRRSIVAVDRMRELMPLGNGDACLRLADGTELRVSRSFRESTRAALNRGH